MHSLFRNLRITVASLLSSCILTATVWAAPAKPQLQITGYVINADLDPSVNRLSATAAVTFTALDDLTAPVFELNNGLQITKVTDASKKPLDAERLTNNSTVRFNLATPLPKGTSTTYYFEYSGTLKGADTSPVEGIKLASVEDPISILLYPGRWFPMTGLFTNRFTAEMHIRVPGDVRVVGSGSGVAAQKSLPGNRTEYTFNWAKPGFPGTIIAGKFLDPITAPGINNIRVYVTEKHKAIAADFAQTAAKQFEFMTTTFGQPESSRLNLVELPDDAVAAAWAPEIVAHQRQPCRRKDLSAATLQHHRPPVVGQRDIPGHPERCLDYERHVALRRADVHRGLLRQDGLSVRRYGYLRRCPGV